MRQYKKQSAFEPSVTLLKLLVSGNRKDINFMLQRHEKSESVQGLDTEVAQMDIQATPRTLKGDRLAEGNA